MTGFDTYPEHTPFRVSILSMERSSFSHWPRCRRQWHTRAVQSEKCVGLHGRA
jgi:hypothetical protein